MGKSKSKKSQPKRYPTPTDKYLIVTDPWGGVPISEPNFFNNVTAWFEIMFRPKHPGVRPSAIFYQWTNKNIVVEIPDHVDVEPYLGAHYWSTFLVPPHCYNVGTRASFIYEFETRFHPIPVNQGGWTPGYAAYTRIRDDFDVKEPYPDPYPAPNSTLPFARKLPQYKVVAADQPPVLPLRELSPPEGLDNEISMPPPPLPVSSNAKGLLKKMDPYEEAEAAIASLLDPPLKPPSSFPTSKSSPTRHRVKQELSNSNSHLHSDDVKPRIKAEEITDEGYQPSEEWTKLFASLEQPGEEEEEAQEKSSLSNDYVPSEDLLKALSSLPESMVESNPSSSSSTVAPHKIKAEPLDDDIKFSPPSPPPYFSKLGYMRERSTTLKDDRTSTSTRQNNDFKIKRELSSDDAYDDPPEKVKRVKLEQ